MKKLWKEVKSLLDCICFKAVVKLSAGRDQQQNNPYEDPRKAVVC